MNRLDKRSRELVESLLQYTEDDLKIINKIDKAWVFGFVVDVDPTKYSTREGIERQLDKFTLPDGLVYYFRMKDNMAVLDKVPVSLEVASFAARSAKT